MLKWILGAIMGLVAVSTLFNLPGHNLLPATLVSAAIGASIIFPGYFRRIPELFWKVYAFAIIPLVSVNILKGELTPTLLDLNTWLILYRALNHEKRREEMQLALLCLFLLIMAGIMTSTLLFGAQLVVFTGVAMSFLIVGTLLESSAGGKVEGVSEKDAWRDQFRWSSFARSANSRSLLYWACAFTLLVSVAALSFVIIPRVDMERQLRLFELDGAKTQSGFSEEIALGEVTDIKNDNSVALRVDVSEGSVAPLEPYWRMLSLDEYSNGRFRMSRHLRRVIDDPEERLSSAIYMTRYWRDKRISDQPSSGPADRWTFYLEPGVSRFLPLLGDFKQLTMPNHQTLRLGPHVFAIAMQKSSSKMVSYQLEQVDYSGRIPAVSVDRFPIQRDADKDRRVSKNSDAIYPETLLDIPDEPALRSYLKEAVEKIRGDEALSRGAFIEKATAFLRERHGYSMQVELPVARDLSDPVVRWMRSDLDGHCELFASSLILLARAAEIPSRVVVGFKGGDWNGFENYFMVRNADAHAWCEFLDDSGDWIRADPTPGSRLPSQPPAETMLTERVGQSDSLAFIDSLRMIWYRKIVNFDEAAQRETALQVKDFVVAYLQVAKRWSQNAYAFLADWMGGPWGFGRLAYLAFLASLLVGAYLAQYNLTFSFREWVVARFRRGDPVRRKAGRLLERCRVRLREEGGETLAKLVKDLQRLRFGAKESWPNARYVFKEARRLL